MALGTTIPCPDCQRDYTVVINEPAKGTHYQIFCDVCKRDIVIPVNAFGYIRSIPSDAIYAVLLNSKPEVELSPEIVKPEDTPPFDKNEDDAAKLVE